MIQLGDLLDNLRHLDRRVFRAMWARMRQFWTAEKWMRVTDDERNVKWVGLNVDPDALPAADARSGRPGRGAGRDRRRRRRRRRARLRHRHRRGAGLR